MIRLDFEPMSPEAGLEVLAPRDQFGLQCSAVELIPGLLQDLGQGPGRRRQGLPAPRRHSIVFRAAARNLKNSRTRQRLLGLRGRSKGAFSKRSLSTAGTWKSCSTPIAAVAAQYASAIIRRPAIEARSSYLCFCERSGNWTFSCLTFL